MAAFYDVFNDKLVEFLKDLTSSFPHVDEFRKLKAGTMCIINIDPKKPRNVFHTMVADKYRASILAKDEQFFLSHNYEAHKDEWEDFIEELKRMWSGLDANNKDTIWKYFNLLLLISDKCTAAR